MLRLEIYDSKRFGLHRSAIDDTEERAVVLARRTLILHARDRMERFSVVLEWLRDHSEPDVVQWTTGLVPLLHGPAIALAILDGEIERVAPQAMAAAHAIDPDAGINEWCSARGFVFVPSEGGPSAPPDPAG